jgi:hypothetical protein
LSQSQRKKRKRSLSLKIIYHHSGINTEIKNLRSPKD